MADAQIEIRFIPFVVTKRKDGLCHGYVENYNPNFKELQHTDMYVREERCLDLNEFYDLCTKKEVKKGS